MIREYIYVIYCRRDFLISKREKNLCKGNKNIYQGVNHVARLLSTRAYRTFCLKYDILLVLLEN